MALREVLTEKQSIYMILEYAEHDLLVGYLCIVMMTMMIMSYLVS
jgi:hypothetical protein